MKRRGFIQASAFLAMAPFLKGCDHGASGALTGAGELSPGRFLPNGDVGRLGWDQFLREWNDEAQDLARAAGLDDWTGPLRSPPIGPSAIAAREQTLGVEFPPSFREFLVASNGWRSPSRPHSDMVRPVSRITWLRDEAPAAIRSWRLYRRFIPERGPRYTLYGAAQDPAYFRSADLPSCLALTVTDDDAPVYLLNTAVVDPVGEFEAWDLDHRLAGAYRYRSFAGLMEVLRQEDVFALRSWEGRST